MRAGRVQAGGLALLRASWVALAAGMLEMAQTVGAVLPQGLSAMYLDVLNATNCHDVCFGSFNGLTDPSLPVGQVLLSSTLNMSEAGYNPASIDSGILTVSPDAVFSAIPDFEGGDPPVAANLSNVVFMTPRDGSAVRIIKLHRGDGWPAKAMSNDLHIVHVNWDSSGNGQLHALLQETGMASGAGPSWGGYCTIDVATGAADWVGAFPMHDIFLFVGAVSAFDPTSSTIYTTVLTRLGDERVYSFTCCTNGAFAASTTWVVGGLARNASLAGLAVCPGKPPVAVVNPIDEQSTPAGASTGGPKVLQLLPDSTTQTLYDFGPDMILFSASLGGTIGADDSVVILLDDSSPATPPWQGDKAVLAIVPLDLESGPVRRLDVAPRMDADSFAGLVYDSP